MDSSISEGRRDRDGLRDRTGPAPPRDEPEQVVVHRDIGMKHQPGGQVEAMARRSAREVVDRHLAAVEARDPVAMEATKPASTWSTGLHDHPYEILDQERIPERGILLQYPVFEGSQTGSR